jgi:hypothetical protein
MKVNTQGYTTILKRTLGTGPMIGSTRRNLKEITLTEQPSGSTAIVRRLWNHCNVLRDNGVSYGDYVEQLTLTHGSGLEGGNMTGFSRRAIGKADRDD